MGGFLIRAGLLLLLSLSNCESELAAEIEIEYNDKINAFNDALVRKIESDEVARFTSQGRLDELRHRIGTLAVYFRLFRQLVPTPTGRGFSHIFPEPPVEFGSDAASNCSRGLEACMNYVFSYLNKTHPWLLAVDGANSETELSRERMKGVINDNAIALELTASQIFCFFTMKEISAFEHLPFCRFRLPSANGKAPMWPAKLFNSDVAFIDEFLGEPFSCALQSFCPDPCCHDVDPSSLLFTERECVENVCRDHRLCTIQPKLNDDLPSMVANKWNVSCPCGEGLFFRPDVGQCVHENICGVEDVCGENEECMNIISGKGYKCFCQLGYVRADKGCVKFGFSEAEWDGPAISDRPSGTVSPLIAPLLAVFVVATAGA